MSETSLKQIKLGIFADGLERKGKGTSIVLQRLLEQFLSMQNFDMRIIYLGSCAHHLCKKIPGIAIRHFRLPILSGFFSYANFFLFNTERFDIVHFPRPSLHPFFWLMKIFGRTKKIVVAFHGAPESHDIPIFETWQTHFNRWLIVLFGKHFIDVGIVLSESAREPVARYYGMPLNRIVVVHAGVDKVFSQIQKHVVTNEEKDYLMQHYGIVCPYVLTVGRVDPHKNIRRLIEGYAKARSKINTFPFLIIVGGKHEPIYTRIVEQTIDKLEVKKYVYFAPFIEDRDLPLVYRCADAFAFVSLSEGFGMPLIEAMASGCPTLASNISAMPEIADGASYLVDPYDINDIADGMHNVLYNLQLRKTLINKGATRSMDFSWERCAKETADIYLKLYTGTRL